MCGLIGFMGELPKGVKKQDVLNFLLILDSTRGIDGTGVYMANVSKDKVTREVLLKNVGNVYNLICSRDYNKCGFVSDVVIGHNRATSVGASTVANSHPFEFGDIVGAHNGTLTSFYESSYPKRNDYEVDSEWIYATINEIGVKRTVSYMSGSWALTWFNKKEQTLNMLRNKERPLFYIRTDNAIIWASEEWMLDAVMDKFVFSGSIKQVDENIHYIWGLDDDKKVVLLDSYELKGHETTYPANYHYYGARYSSKKKYKGNTIKKCGTGGLTCAACGTTGLFPIDIDYGYDVRINGEEVRQYICKDCNIPY